MILFEFFLETFFLRNEEICSTQIEQYVFSIEVLLIFINFCKSMKTIYVFHASMYFKGEIRFIDV